MNSHEARRAMLANPRLTAPSLDAAMRDDASLAGLRQQLLQADERIAKAFSDVTPPPGLAERVILRVQYRQQQRRRSRWAAGIAASVVIAVAAIFGGRPESPSPIALAMLDHVVEGVDELADAGNVSVQTAQASLGRIGVGFRDAGYQIRHLAECVVAGRTGRHLVMNTPHGLVSFLILPTRRGEVDKRQVLHKGEFQAVLQPSNAVAIGVFASRTSDTRDMEAMLKTMFFDNVRAV